MTATETRGRRLILKWTAPKGFAALILFVVIAVLIEVSLIIAFQTTGLWDRNVWTATYLIPYATWSFTISISPLFHLLPLSVIIVLLSSWQYLTKHTTFVPQRVEASKRVQPPSRRTQESRRFRSLRQFSKRLTRRLQRTGRSIKANAQKIKGVSYISQRLHFARAAVRSASTVVFAFLAILLTIVLIEYPDSIHQWTLNLYRSSPALLYFVRGIGQWLAGIGQAVPSLNALGSGIYNALASTGPGFRRSLESFGTSLASPLANADLDAKYVLSQNVAAWTSALVAVVYGAYASSHPRRRPRGR